MQILKKGALIVLLVSILLVGCSNSRQNNSFADADNKESVTLLVGAAASLRSVMEELQKTYNNQQQNVDIVFTFGSSGSIQHQIQQGAPVDVFISAAQKQMDTLIDERLIVEETKIDLLKNKVVLIVPKDSRLDITSFKDILKAPRIALGDPASVPVGQYSKEIFIHLGMFDDVNEKAAYAKDVAEVLAWVRTGVADAGVVYASDVVSSKEVIIVAEAPEDSCSKVVYPVAVVKRTKEKLEAMGFVGFLSSDQAKKVFKKYGFLPIE